jgi:uncharacterized lipoprotein YajG
MEMVPGTTLRSKNFRTGIACSLTIVLAAALMLAGCGKKEETPVAEKPAEKSAAPSAGTASACVTCHTDKEKLKMETAGIKRPKGSALTSGKG